MIAEALPLPSRTLRGAGFVFRPFAPADYAPARAARDEPESARWVNPLPQPDGEMMARFFDEARQAGKLLHLAIADEDTGDYLGEILLFLRTPEAAELDAGEIAYVVAPAARGRGIAASAVKLLSEWAFTQLGLQRLHLSIHPDNAASRRVAEKAGYSYEGTLRSLKMIRGQRVDTMIWSLLPGEL